MSRKDKAVHRIKELPKDYAWNEAKALLIQLGFTELQGSGSRVKFHHREKMVVISLHRPHPNPEMRAYAVKELRDNLISNGMIK